MIKTKLIFATALSLFSAAQFMERFMATPVHVPTVEAAAPATPPQTTLPIPPTIEPAPSILGRPVALPTEAKPIGFRPGHSKLRFGHLIKLHAQTSRSVVQSGKTNTVYVQIDLNAKNKASSTRSNLAVALVIDRSGSMDGEKMEQTRRASQALIARLADDDQIAIISYANHAQVDLGLVRVRDVGRKHIGNLVNGLYAAGGTNLSSGLQSAIELLKAQGQAGLVRRVIIMSDGNANKGITSSHQLSQIVRSARRSGVSVTSMGVGLDFNEDLMTVLAENGGGRYYFIEDVRSLQKALATELRGLSEVIAQQLEIRMELPKNIELVRVFGFPIKRIQNTITIPIGDISKGEHRQIIAELKIPAAKTGPLPLGKIRMTYIQSKPRKQFSQAKKLSVAVSSARRHLRNAENLQVSETVNTILAAQTRIEVANAYSDGDVDGALRQIRTQMISTKKAAKRLKSSFLGALYDELSSNAERMTESAPSSVGGRSIIKNEKNRARNLQVYGR